MKKFLVFLWTMLLVFGLAGSSAAVDMLVMSVPEPSTMLLLGSGLIGLAVLGRKKLFKK